MTTKEQEKSNKKAFEFASVISMKLGELFESDSDITIDKDDLVEHATEFFHALANLSPAFIYNQIANEQADLLEFNHIANRLVHQFSSTSDEVTIEKTIG